MRTLVTNLSFKTSDTAIVILKELPVLQCDSCSEYLLDDPVLGRIVVQKSLFQVNWLKIPKKQGDSTRSGGKTYLGSYIEKLLEKVDAAAELEIIKYAA